MNAAMARQLAGDRAGAEDLAERTIALTDKYGFQPYRLGGLILRAWAQGSLHYHAESIELVEREIERAIAVGPNGQQLLGLAAEIMLAGNRHTEAMVLLHRALSANEEAHVGYYLPEIHRLRGECLLALDHDNEDEAQQAFLTARDIASRQGAIILAHRAEASLVRADRV